MARKYELITELYRETLDSIVKSQGTWRDFLRSACNNYKLSFEEQVLVYAQRPDATAVLEIERWNKQFGRWVNAGATGIAVFDKEHTGRSRLKHYFDVSDTHGSRFARPVPIWEIKESYEPEIIETLQASFDVSETVNNLDAALIQAVSNVVEDNYHDYLAELMNIRDGSFLEELDELNVKKEFTEALECSVMYMVLERCMGGAADQFAKLADFAPVMNFNTPATVTALGCTASDMSEMVLREVALTVRNIQIREKNQNRTFAKEPEIDYSDGVKETKSDERSFEDEYKLHDEGRVSSAEPAAPTGAGGNAWEVRASAPDISQREPENYLYESADNGQAERAFDGNRADGSLPDGAVDAGNGKSRGRDGEPESDRSDKMGGVDEQHPSLGGGNRDEGTDLQLKSEENADGSEKELPAFLNEKLIFGIVGNKEDDLKYKKSQIELFFSVHTDADERAEYIKSSYQDRYTEVMVDGVRVGYRPQDDGLLMWEGSYLSRKSETVFSWDCVAGFISQHINKKEYYINTDIKGLKTQSGQQMSLFDFAADLPPYEPSEQITLFPTPKLSQQIIDESLCIGSNEEHSRMIICAYFIKDKSLEENAAFLRKHYGTNGAGFYFDNRKISIWYDNDGIRIAEGMSAYRSSATLLSWEDAAKRIRELLDMGRYMPQSELMQAESFERNKLAESIALTARDFSEEAIAANYAPIIRLALSANGGFPEIEKQISDLLADPEMRQKITDEWSEFVTAHEANRDLLRFRFYRPKEILQKLTDLQREQLTFTAAEDYDPKRRFFISGDEIDEVLRSGGDDYRLSVYAFFRTHSDKAEREKYVKSYHGEYSGSYNGNDNLTYTRGKGIDFSHGSITEPYAKEHIKWNQATKRIAELISQGKFLSDKDKATMPDYERGIVARAIHGFFYNIPDEYPRPFSSDPIGDYWEGVQEVKAQLLDADQVDNIYNTMLLPVWESTKPDDRNYDRRNHGIEVIRAYLDGTYSVFGLGNTLEPLSEIGVSSATEISEELPAETEASSSTSGLAQELLHFYEEYDPYGYKDELEIGDNDGNALDKLEQELHNPVLRKNMRDTLQEYLDDTDPDEDIAVDLQLFLEKLDALEDAEPEELPAEKQKFKETVSDIWQSYQALKQQHPDALCLNAVGAFYECYDKDAGIVAQALGLTITRREIPGLAEKQRMTGIPENRLNTYIKMLNDRGYDVALSYGEITDRQTEFHTSKNKDAPVNSYPVGRIDYLGSGGAVGESNEFTNADEFIATIKNQNYYGVPMSIVVYRGADGEAIPTDFAATLDPPPQGFEIIDSPYIEKTEEKKPSAVLAPLKQKRERVLFRALHPEIPKEQRHDFHIRDNELGNGTPSEKYAANVAAIRTLKKIEANERLATPEEQEILSHYVGWGGLADCFDERNPHYQELKSLLDEDEYTAARESTLTAFYTSPVIIGAMYQALSQMGFQNGNILEPSCGVGNFIGMKPDGMDGKIYGVEIDSISGRIAAQLYQNSDIAVNGFEKVEMPDSFFDVAIGNVPFADQRVLDKRYDKNHWLIHDYFFGKTLDKVRPGGIIAFITSKGTLDKENSSVRKYLAQRADLIGAIRLPNNAFKRNAGTKVTSDIIFLQKRDRMTDIEPDWVHLDIDENAIRMNSYFVQNPDMVLGEMVMETSQFGMESTCKPYEDSDLSEQLREAITNLHAQITEYEIEEPDTEEDLSIPADPAVRNFSYTVSDGKLYFRENSRMHPVGVSVTGENRIRGMITLRDCVRKLIEYQTENYPDDEIKKAQTELNTLYDAFVKKYDRLFTRGNSLAFSEDSSYCLLCSLEVLDDEGNFKRKADMFSKRTIKPHIPVTSVDTASEALALSISEKAQVDMEYMSSLTGKTAVELEHELTGAIFRDVSCPVNPEEISEIQKELTHYPLVSADEFLSGNVRRKLQMLHALGQVLPAEEKERLQTSIAAMEAVQPVDLTAAEISVRIGATWIPPEIYRQFMFETFETGNNGRRNMNILYSKCTGEWNVTNKSSDYGNIKAVTTYGTNRINAYHIFEQTLNLKDVRIFDTKIVDGNEKRELNKKETAIAQDRQEIIKMKFVEWLWKDIDRREKLCKIYNETFNSVRPREYDGSHIVFSGMNPEITLRKHQIDAIAHVMYGGNTLLAHEVGAGKTYEMTAAAMEMKRLGLCSKSLIVVPNHITGQWAAEFLQLYPSANILVTTKKDFERQNRRKICARIATGEYDAVIIGHSQFEKIPMSKERQEEMIRRQIQELIFGIQEAKKANAERYTVKQLEKTKKALEVRMAKLNDQTRKDDVVTFEELGIDRIFIDESHYYKNLFLMTKMRNVGGIAQTEAQKSSDLFMKCQYLDEITGSKGTIFATGTPISNSMVELYTIQRYLQYRVLQEMGLQHFDEWAATFGETVTAIEMSPEGTGYRAKTRFAKFYNLPELMSVFKQVADIQTADMLHLPVPKANFHVEVIPPSPLQKEMVAALAERAQAVRDRLVDPSVDNMLKITNDGRKLALDVRLINPLATDDGNSKVSVCANNVYRIWEQSKENRSAQLVFCDLSTPKGIINMNEQDGESVIVGFQNVYDDLRKKLIARGISEEEIAFIHDANTEVRKQELFAKVRSGAVRVLMGSTQKMGAGTNCQDRLIALHDLDCPWRPSDLAQRLGRIVRQGNKNPEVEIFRYVTEGTFDSYLYQLVENKQKFIAQIMTSKTPLRAAEDIDETALNYAEIKALASGNPMIVEKCNLDMEVGKLNMLKANHLNQKYALEEYVYRKYPEHIGLMEGRAKGYEQDIELVKQYPKVPDVFPTMEIKGVTHTEKESAGKAIIDACTKMTGSDAVMLGAYRGFSMVLAYESTKNEYRLTLKGTLSHTVVLGADINGNLTRIDNMLGSFPEKLSNIREELDNTNKQLENARTEMEAPFAKEAELTEKSARLKQLNTLLNLDEKDRSVIDSTPEEDVPEKPKSREYER